MPTTPLPDDAIDRALAGLPGWARRGGAIVKEYTAPTFPTGIALVARVAEAAEAADHHPDIDIRYTRVAFALSTHDAGNRVSEKDVALAREIERMAGDVLEGGR